jgi:hypothetical protein
VVVFAATTLALAACGFVASGNRPSTKPDAFLLHGYVSVGGTNAADTGPACQAPAWASDIREGGAVRVADADGHTLGTGQLANGVRSGSGPAVRCNFGFEISGVRGGVDRYVIGVGSRGTVSFPAHDLRENKPAVIPVDP